MLFSAIKSNVRDNLNDTEIALKRVRGLITKLPKFHNKL